MDSSHQWNTSIVTQALWHSVWETELYAHRQAERLQTAKQYCRQYNKALVAAHMHTHTYTMSPLYSLSPGTVGVRYALSTMPASMGPAPLSCPGALLGCVCWCVCRRHRETSRAPSRPILLLPDFTMNLKSLTSRLMKQVQHMIKTWRRADILMSRTPLLECIKAQWTELDNNTEGFKQQWSDTGLIDWISSYTFLVLEKLVKSYTTTRLMPPSVTPMWGLNILLWMFCLSNI